MYLLILALSLAAAAWGETSPRGNAPRWEAMGPFGGSAAVVQVDPAHAGVVMAATNNSLFFRSVNGGDRWEPLAFPAQLRSTLHAFAISPSGLYYAGLSSDNRELAGLYRSSDAGSTWQQLKGLAGKEVWSLAIWERDAAVLAAGTRDGVYLTSDGGANWKHISPDGNEELAPVVSLAIDPQDQKAIYAGTPHLPWKTEDGGANWHPVHEGMLDDSDVFSIHIDAHQSRRVFASACSGIYRSENGGAGWTKMKGATGASYRTYIITQDPLHPELVYAGTTYGLAKSSDGGVTWRRISRDATRWIAFDSAHPGRMYFAADEAGILRSDDGGETVHPVNQGFCNRQLTALAWTGSSAVTASIYEPSHGGVFELEAASSDWKRIATPAALPAQILKLEANGTPHLFASSYDSIFSSADGGRTWLPAAGPKGTKVSGFLGLSDSLFAATGAGLFRSAGVAAAGRAWSRVAGPFGSQSIRVLAPIGPSGLAAATATAIFVSMDGVSWRTTAPLPNAGSVNSIVSAGGRRLLAGTTAGLIRSEDFGASWEPVFWGLGGSSVSAIRQHPTLPDTVFVAQYGVVYRSADGGDTWVRISPDRGSRASSPELETIKALAILPGVAGSSAPDRLLVLTQNQGTFALPLGAPAGAGHPSISVSGKIGKNLTAQ